MQPALATAPVKKNEKPRVDPIWQVRLRVRHRSAHPSARAPVNDHDASSTDDHTEVMVVDVPEKLRPLLVEVLAAIDRTHGRLGKILICQFLCGSSNSKVQKLRLHRLSGFGMLSDCGRAMRQSW